MTDWIELVIIIIIIEWLQGMREEVVNSRSFPGFSLIEQREIMKNIKRGSWCPG
jgi:hypothetical protein